MMSLLSIHRAAESMTSQVIGTYIVFISPSQNYLLTIISGKQIVKVQYITGTTEHAM